MQALYSLRVEISQTAHVISAYIFLYIFGKFHKENKVHIIVAGQLITACTKENLLELTKHSFPHPQR